MLITPGFTFGSIIERAKQKLLYLFFYGGGKEIVRAPI